MLVRNPQALKATLESGQRLVGLDVGSKTVGIALSDPRLSIASPHSTLKRGKFSVVTAQLGELVRKKAVGGIVIGLPINMDGSEGPRAQSAWQTGINLVHGLKIPVLMWDERLSTFEAGEILTDRSLSKRRREVWLDAVATSVILRDALGALERA